MNLMPNIHTISGIALATLGTLGAFVFGVGVAVFWDVNTPREYAPTVVLSQETLTAKAVVLLDAQTGEVLYQKNANKPLPLASLTKLMSAYVVLNSRPAHQTIEITQGDIATEGDSGLKAGERVTLSELIRLGLVASSNDAMAAAVGSLGINPIAKLNDAAYELGLTQSTFRNPTGLDVNTVTPGAEGTAYDVARLALALYKAHPEYFEQTSKQTVSISTNTEVIEDSATTLPLQSLPGLIAAKTGTTDLAGANLVALVDLSIGKPVVGVVLGSTANERFTDMKTLIEAARAQLSL